MVLQFKNRILPTDTGIKMCACQVESMSAEIGIRRLQSHIDAYNLLLDQEDVLTVRYNAFPVHERSNADAGAVLKRYRHVYQKRILANATIFHATMDLYYITGNDDQLWPQRLRHLHPGKQRVRVLS
jgi:hypothetical protein